MDRVKLFVLALLLILWAALIGFRFLTSPEPQHVPLKYLSGQRQAHREEVLLATAVPVVKRLPLSRPPASDSRSTSTPRNIFAPLLLAEGRTGTATRSPSQTAKGQTPQGEASPSAPPRAVYVPAPPPPAPPPPSPEELAAQQERARREHAVQQARQHLAQFRFLGHWTEHGQPTAFLSKGTELFLVRQGEIVEDQIHLARAGDGAVTLHDPATRVERTIPLTADGQTR
jgi:hypothetical protein